MSGDSGDDPARRDLADHVVAGVANVEIPLCIASEAHRVVETRHVSRAVLVASLVGRSRNRRDGFRPEKRGTGYQKNQWKLL